MKIDFVIPWVNGGDPAWRKEKYKYMGIAEPDAGEERYRDMGILKYWFRAVEAYAPWVNQIHFVTWGHLPEWLNTEHPKLHIVNHKDYIPEEYLPTFSSRPIELNFHRIPGLSEHFVYFNDDMLLNAPITPEFFFKNGLPCDFANIDNICSEGMDDVYSHTLFNESYVISCHYSYLRSFIKHPFKYLNMAYTWKANLKNLLKIENSGYFAGFEEHHLASPYCKKTFVDFWEKAHKALEQASMEKFRTPYGVSQRIFRYAQIASGQFHPVSKASRGKAYQLWMDLAEIQAAILSEDHKMICLNDTSKEIDFDAIIRVIQSAYEQKLPERSTFEK